MLRLSFTDHPASVGESYGEHFRSACGFSASMICGGLACLVHAIFPFLFVTTGSSAVRKLYENMVIKRVRISVDGTREPATLPMNVIGKDDVQQNAASAEKRQTKD